VDVSVELAVCRLLLGDAVAAYRILAEEGCSEVRGLIEASASKTSPQKFISPITTPARGCEVATNLLLMR
jgi:hypothetical protein